MKYQKAIHEKEKLIYPDDEILYTTPDVSYDYFKQPYSVSKINLFISQFIFCLWLLLMFYLFFKESVNDCYAILALIPILTIGIVILLFVIAKRSK